MLIPESVGRILTWCDRMDVHEDEKSNTVTATFELPGLKKEDVNIDVRNDVLTVSGETKVSSERDENGYAVRERRFGRFLRSIPLPQGIKVGTFVVWERVSGMLTYSGTARGDQGVARERCAHRVVP